MEVTGFSHWCALARTEPQSKPPSALPPGHHLTLSPALSWSMFKAGGKLSLSSTSCSPRSHGASSHGELKGPSDTPPSPRWLSLSSLSSP